MLKHLLAAHPEHAGSIRKGAYKRVIKTDLTGNAKQFLAWARDHNVDPYTLLKDAAHRLASVLFKTAKAQLGELQRPPRAPDSQIKQAKEALSEKAAALAKAKKALDEENRPNLELRSFLGFLMEVMNKQARPLLRALERACRMWPNPCESLPGGG